jgi:DHA1 family bicyclomycin/chloramphenicol resistance-like MFS transporter
VLGLLIAVGAFAIDMYIPGFAAITRDLRTSPGTMQLSMTSFFVALAMGQLVYGPVSDVVGRKPPVYAGLAVFVIASGLAAFAPSIEWLVAARFFQGLGAAATAVIPMAIVRDEYVGPDAARLLSLAMLALSISPILAPVFGGLVVQYMSWRMIFVVLMIIACLAMAMVWRMLPETLPPAQRTKLRIIGIGMTYGRLLRSRNFMAPILIAGFAQCVLFVFISGSPFVFVTLHHIQPTTFGILFALHAMMLIGISQFNAPMMRWFGTKRLIGGASILVCVVTLGLAGLVANGMSELWPFVALTLVMFTGLGLVMAPAFLTAMEPFGAIAGAAAAMGAGLEFAMSSAMTAAMSLCADGTARPMTLFLALSACGSFASWVLFVRTPAAAVPDVESTECADLCPSGDCIG